MLWFPHSSASSVFSSLSPTLYSPFSFYFVSPIFYYPTSFKIFLLSSYSQCHRLPNRPNARVQILTLKLLLRGSEFPRTIQAIPTAVGCLTVKPLLLKTAHILVTGQEKKKKNQTSTRLLGKKHHPKFHPTKDPACYITNSLERFA